MSELDTPPAIPPPRTTTVVGLLALATLIFSYLVAYGLMGVLVSNDVVQRWKPDHDPRPVWLGTMFTVLMLLFLGTGVLLRWMSKRQLRRLDKLDEDAANDATS